MCTAATYKTKDFYFGRTLDYEISYGDKIVITPRNYVFNLRCGDKLQSHYAMIGSDALIYRLLFNLTENAIKYNRPNGSVRVSVSQEDKQLLFRVSDTGCGIPEVYQRSIFQPFFRVDKSRSREYGGAGLGLSLVWEIADLHGGSVWVEKSSEKGTTIAVELPTQQSTKP